jgi:hypothetical protein
MPQANKPAMTSGPGALSRRTDGGPASKQAIRYVSGMPNYGDAQALMDMQASAPMAKTNNPPSPAPASSMQPQQGGEPSQQEIQTIPIHAPHDPNAPMPTEPYQAPQQLQTTGMTNALGLLNQLGDKASPQVKAIRDALMAHINNSAQVGNQ